jgi:hypothetical protein
MYKASFLANMRLMSFGFSGGLIGGWLRIFSHW